MFWPYTMKSIFTLLLAVLSSSTTTASTTTEGPCRDGFLDGRRIVKYQWNRKCYQNCDNIWDLADLANDAADRTYVSSSNWRQREFNRCARLGVADMVGRYERLCLDDNSDQCLDLAVAAAQSIAVDFGCLPPMAKVPGSTTSIYQSNCRQVAINNCPGSLTTTLKAWCPNKTITTTKRLELESKCGSKVNGFLNI
jgi:hypothetical protein